MRIVIVNPVWDRADATPTATLAHFHTLTGWADAIHTQGAVSVTVCQRHHTTAALTRNGVVYRFCADRRRPIPRRSTRATPRFHQIVADAQPDLVHVNGLVFPELIRGLRAALPSATALVVQDHGGFDATRASALTRIWLRRGLAAADAVLVASSGQADALRQSRIAPSDTLIADVMESSTTLRPISRAQARADLGMMGAPALLWVGRLNENKDPLTVLRGAAEWFRGHPRATLTMVCQSGELDRAARRLVASEPELTQRVTLVGAKLPSARFDMSNLEGSMLAGIDISNGSLRGANLDKAVLDGANLRDTDFSPLPLAGVANSKWPARAKGIRGHKTDFRGANLKGVDFTESSLRDADFRQADLTGARLVDCDLTGADLREAITADADLRGVIGMK